MELPNLFMFRDTTKPRERVWKFSPLPPPKKKQKNISCPDISILINTEGKIWLDIDILIIILILHDQLLHEESQVLEGYKINGNQCRCKINGNQ